MPAVSVIIPNYNGQKLLAHHLPSVLKALRTDDELLIIDDQSTDESWQWLNDEFPAGVWQDGKKKGPVTLIHNAHNLRFGASCNRAVDHAKYSLVFIINSDVSPHPDVLAQLVPHFTDSSIFAVGCLEHEVKAPSFPSEPAVIGGKNTLTFQRGMFIHGRAETFDSGETAWASGGSALFDRAKWQELGGFDQDFFPAYWEDIDLSYRAKKKGWQVLFDQAAQVDHDHESTNTSAFGKKQMKAMSWRHAHTFVWKHGTWKQKLQYLLWQPYWWVKLPIYTSQQLQLVLLAIIVLMTIATRAAALGQVPHGMTWDEAAIGYNGFAVATTGRDEWLKKLPISFQSFGDYKAPLAIYITGAFIRVFGLSLTVVRLPFMLAGIISVLGMMVLTKLLWTEWVDRRRATFPVLNSTQAALFIGALMSVSAWHVHFSRIGFESGIALAFLIWGVVGLLLLLQSKKLPGLWQRLLYLGSSVFLAASLYTYHSSKIVTPLLLLCIAVLYRRHLKKRLFIVTLWVVVLVALLVPLLYDSFHGVGGGRFQQASIFGKHLPLPELTSTLASHFITHFSPNYLMGGETPTLRHGDGKWGVLYPTEVCLGLAACLGFLVGLHKKIKVLPTGLTVFAILWIVIGTLPAAIGVDVPHSNRMLLALPGFLLLAVLGWQWIATVKKNTLTAPAVLGLCILLHTFFVVSYLHHYYTDFAASSANDFSDGYLDAMKYAYQHEDSVDKVLFTSQYQQPYIYALFSRQTSPYEYHNGSLIKYEFTDHISVGELLRKNTLIIATPAELDPRLGTYLINGSDGKPRFVIVKTP